MFINPDTTSEIFLCVIGGILAGLALSSFLHRKIINPVLGMIVIALVIYALFSGNAPWFDTAKEHLSTFLWEGHGWALVAFLATLSFVVRFLAKRRAIREERRNDCRIARLNHPPIWRR